MVLLLDELEILRKEVQNCRKCSLWKNRKHAVFGEGPADADIFLIGLGPGYNENLQGRPFVGAAGKLLDKLLKFAGLERSSIYISNVVKCYLPDNRATEEQINICTSNYLDKQLNIIRPKIIIPLGNIATQYLFGKFSLEQAPMNKIHGQVFVISNLFFNAKIIPMYHPAAALRNPGLNEILEADWKNLAGLLKYNY